jgi:hypothetical protein
MDAVYHIIYTIVRTLPILQDAVCIVSNFSLHVKQFVTRVKGRGADLDSHNGTLSTHRPAMTVTHLDSAGIEYSGGRFGHSARQVRQTHKVRPTVTALTDCGSHLLTIV